MSDSTALTGQRSTIYIKPTSALREFLQVLSAIANDEEDDAIAAADHKAWARAIIDKWYMDDPRWLP